MHDVSLSGLERRNARARVNLHFISVTRILGEKQGEETRAAKPLDLSIALTEDVKVERKIRSFTSSIPVNGLSVG